MPSHLLYLLQSLDIGYFLPLKRACSDKISGLVCNYINHIIKTKFLPAFKAAFFKVFIKENICLSFRGIRLIPFNPNIVILKLNIKLYMPTPLTPEDTP